MFIVIIFYILYFNILFYQFKIFIYNLIIIFISVFINLKDKDKKHKIIKIVLCTK